MDTPVKVQLTRIDSAISSLMEERLALVAEAAKTCKQNGLPATSLDLETPSPDVSHTASPAIQDACIRLHHHIDRLSLEVARRTLSGIRVAYAGVKGAFAEMAAGSIYPDGALFAYADFASAYHAVEAGDADCAVLPIENSFAGDVAGVMDLAYFGSLSISGVYDFPIEHHLLGVSGANTDTIRTVISHPQALGQCADYLRRHGYISQEATNTAVAAKTVRDANDPAMAAIGSIKAAEEWGLVVLDRHIHESSFNTTRFAVFTAAPHTGEGEDTRFILTFTVPNEAGALGRAITCIGAHGFNMRVLRSRPTKKLLWSNFFYVEGEGSLLSPKGDAMLAELRTYCSGLKVLGSFPCDSKV